MEKQNFLEQFHTFTASNVDANQFVTPKHILEILQDIAVVHASHLGFGWEELQQVDRVWVLSKIRVELKRPLKKNEKVKLVTYPLEPNRFFAIREFFIEDEYNTRVLSATSRWALLDINSRQMLNPMLNDEFFSGPYKTEGVGVNKPIGKIVLNDDFLKCFDKAVMWSDLDMNFHVNNTNYVQYAVDCASTNLHKKAISAFEVTYYSETRLGETISLYKRETETELFVLGIKNEKTCFTAKIEFAD